MLLHLSRDLSKSMRKSNSIHYDISHSIAVMCSLYRSKTEEFLEKQISSARSGTEVEGVEPKLELEVIPICFFEAPKDILLEHGNFIVRDTWIKKRFPLFVSS